MNGIYNGLGEIKKTTRGTSEDGSHIVWMEKKPERRFTCKCGSKYLKTRQAQKTCVRCILYPRLAK